MAEDSSIRDSLARDRTHLANQRTLLSYIRTGLGFLFSAAVIFRLDQSSFAQGLSIFLIVIGSALILLGFYIYLKFKSKINKAKN